jgi:putative ABC transport system permease protein
MLSPFARDVRFAVRQFRGCPGFTATAVVVLALGLGANTAIFSVVYLFLLRPLSFSQPDRLVTVTERARGRSGDEGMGLSPGNFLDWQQQSRSFEKMAAFTTGVANLSSDSNAFEPQRVQVCYCSTDFLATLRASPELGRAFRPDEDRYQAQNVALISHRLWQNRLGSAPDIVGKSIRLDGDSYEIVGVMPREAIFPNDSVEVWTPLFAGIPPTIQIRRDLHFVGAIARLRDGVQVESARAELDGIVSRYRHDHPDIAMGVGAIVTPLHDALVHDSHGALLIVLGAVGCVLLIACVNVANLLLTRASGRVRELSIRTAIGASRGEIVRQLLTESALLALAGGAAGVALAAFLTPVLMAHTPGAGALVSVAGASLEPAVFLFAFAIALACGIAVGMYPALESARTDPAIGLRESTRSASGSRSHVRFRAILIAGEVALSLVLLVASGLLVRSFQRLLQVKPGFRTENMLAMTFSFPNSYKTAAQRSAFFQQVSRTCNPCLEFPRSG